MVVYGDAFYVLPMRDGVRFAERRNLKEEVARMPGLSPEPARSSDVEIHLDRILQQLPAYEREAILLRYVHDYSPAEIAALTHTTEAAAKKRLVRAAAGRYVNDSRRRG